MVQFALERTFSHSAKAAQHDNHNTVLRRPHRGFVERRREKKAEITREIRILSDYLHSHVLRINGHNSDAQILVSARELDCLKWTAAGKTAWEASVILGISERTVRFHLNAAREKLDCATTTQAVAKAITQHLIDV